MATTKCDKCDGEGVRWVDGSKGGCNWCSGTGVAGTPFIRAIEECENFIDVEATLRADVARLTAEVERLEGRDTSRPLAVGDVVTIDGEVGMVAYVGSERCRVVWSTEEVTSESTHATITARAAWLAKCKP